MPNTRLRSVDTFIPFLGNFACRRGCASSAATCLASSARLPISLPPSAKLLSSPEEPLCKARIPAVAGSIRHSPCAPMAGGSTASGYAVVFTITDQPVRERVCAEREHQAVLGNRASVGLQRLGRCLDGADTGLRQVRALNFSAACAAVSVANYAGRGLAPGRWRGSASCRRGHRRR